MYKKIIIGSALVVLIVIGLIINYNNQKSKKVEIITPKEEVISFDITVQIIGEVNKPGIYEISSESRVYDLVLLAGGFTTKADTNINLVQKLKDGMIITVKALEISAKQSKISINNAPHQQLISLPNIGPSLANEIIAFREKNGPFNRVNDLVLVNGITDKILIALLPYIVL